MKVNERLLERAAKIMQKYRGLEILCEYAARLEIELEGYDPYYQRVEPESPECVDDVANVLDLLQAEAAGDMVSLSVSVIARRAGLSEIKVRQALEKLMEAESIALVEPNRGRKPATYKILPF
jgi:hypothetical protein